jgi:hypothetical protein
MSAMISPRGEGIEADYGVLSVGFSVVGSAAASRTSVSSTRRSTSGSGCPPRGWVITNSGKSDMPSCAASIFPIAANTSVQMTAVGTPAFWSSTASWTLHDVQDPQSPDPVMTTSH